MRTRIRILIAGATMLAAAFAGAAPASATSRPSAWQACRWGCAWGNYARTPTQHVLYRYTKIDQYGDKVDCTVYWDWANDTVSEVCH